MGYKNNIMKHLRTKSAAIVAALFLVAGGTSVAFPLIAHATDCTSTGFYRDSTNMTAAVINPTSTVTGTINAAGCNIGVYFGPGHNGTVDGATITGADYYGVAVQQAKVNVRNSNINTIGDVPLDGSQHGIGIYYATVAGLVNDDCTTGSTRGTIENNSISSYQKNGISVVCTGTNVNIKNNIVQGQGPVNYIAQNGIEVGYGANASVTGNIVTGNAYTGANGASSGGILVFGGAPYGGAYTTDTQISNNIVIGNDVGIYLSNVSTCGATSCTATKTRTNIDVSDNTIANASLTNTTGDSMTPPQGYQAGISDQGDHDTITNNQISGIGYDPSSSSSSIAVFQIDVTSTNHPKVHHN